MMQESDVKVQDTSDDANSKLMIRDHQQLHTNNKNITQLNQIISPTEVIANPP